MDEKLTLQSLAAAVAGHAAALRSITTLQPAGGPGDKIFPPTYSGGGYAEELRVIPGKDQPVRCVLLDSVQSQANRAEEALKLASQRGEISLPLIVVDFSKANQDFLVPIPNLTSLDVPHRLADAILRDSQLADGTRFSKSKYAGWRRSNLWDATAIFELCPTALIFGLWGSPDKPGGLGAKFERAYISEIVAVDIQEPESRDGFRIDPAMISSKVKVKPNPDGGFKLDEARGVKPSEINHGNILFSTPNAGIRCAFAEQTTVISLGALRKLYFPQDGKVSAERDNAARTVLAALSLCAGALAAERGTSLRSRCHLWPTEPRSWELLDKPGQPPRRFAMSAEDASKLLAEASAAAKKAGLPWNSEPIRLTPSKELADLIRKSQEIQAKEKGDDSEDAQTAGAGKS